MSAPRKALAAWLRRHGPEFVDLLAATFEEEPEPAAEDDAEELVDREQAMARRLCSGAKWDAGVRDGRLPVVRAGRKYVARVVDVLALARVAVPPRPNPAPDTPSSPEPERDNEYNSMVASLADRRARGRR